MISGYLITALLVTECDATGSIRLGAFWVRRIRRLIPALAVMLVGTALWMPALDWTLVARARTALAASLGYVTNWYFTAVPLDTSDPLGRPPLYEHLWSLAVEERFYLVWPIVLALALTVFAVRKGMLLAGVLAGAAGSCALAWVLFSPGADTTLHPGHNRPWPRPARRTTA